MAKQRTPKWGAEAKHKKKLVDKALSRAVRDPDYQAAYTRAEKAFDEVVATAATSSAVSEFWSAVGDACACARIAGGIALAELTTPMIGENYPACARMVADAIAANYETLHPDLAESSGISRFREELAKQPMVSAIPPLRLSALRPLVGDDWEPIPGHPPGPDGPFKDLNVEATKVKILAIMAALLKDGWDLTEPNVASRLGDGVRRETLSRAMRFHGLRFADLKRHARASRAALKAKMDDADVRAGLGHLLDDRRRLH